MKAFRFPLQRVLDVKVLLEKQRRMGFAAAQRDAVVAQSELTQMTKMHAASVALGNAGALEADPLLRSVNWRERIRLSASVQRQAEVLLEKQQIVDEQRVRLLEKRKERRSLELLETKQRQRHREQGERRQQLLVDDLFGARFGRVERRNDDA